MLFTAVLKNHLESTKILSKDSDLEIRDEDDDTVLMKAAKSGFLPIISCLVQAGAKLDSCNSARQSPLFLAAWTGQEEAVKLLIRLGADIDLADKRGWTPLMIAVHSNNRKMAEILVDRGCDLEKTDSFGKQALDRARTPEMMELLKKAISRKRKKENKEKNLKKGKINNPSLSCSPRSQASSASSPRYSRSSNEITLNIRKIMKEKIDKRVRDRFFQTKDDFSKLHQIFVNVLEDEKTRAADQVRKFVIDKTREKTWDFFGNLQKFNQKILKQARPSPEVFENDLKTEEKKHMKEKIEELVKNEINRNFELSLNELKAFAGSYIEKTFYRASQEKSQNFSFKPKKRLSLTEVPSFDVKKTLKGFLSRSEKD